MSRKEIVEDLARRKRVEEFLGKLARGKWTAEMSDLVQDIYLTLLTYDEEKIVGMHERGQLDWFVARIVTNQFSSKTSPFYYTYARRYCRLLPDEENKQDDAR